MTVDIQEGTKGRLIVKFPYSKQAVDKMLFTYACLFFRLKSWRGCKAAYNRHTNQLEVCYEFKRNY